MRFAKVPSRSRYDELHDKYTVLLTTKSGTRYERLAAIVFKALQESNVVIHDVRLFGESEVPHQIDIKISISDRERRVIIECKDFDVSGQKVGLEIVRNFWAVAEDTKPDEAIILTCNGFTRDAAKYAKVKGIKLAVLRVFEDSDWESRIKTIVVQVIAISQVNHEMTINIESAAEKERFECALQAGQLPRVLTPFDPVCIVKDGRRVPITQFVESAIRGKAALTNDAGRAVVEIKSDGWLIEVRGHPPFAFRSLNVSFENRQHKSEISITSKRIAELIVTGLVDADIIIFGDQLERHKIDVASGEVV